MSKGQRWLIRVIGVFGAPASVARDHVSTEKKLHARDGANAGAFSRSSRLVVSWNQSEVDVEAMRGLLTPLR
jgi:hypothetical protein